MKNKAISIFIIITIILCFVGCGKNIKDIEKYEEKAVDYICEKYASEFTLVESYVNKEILHTIVVTDNNGVIVNVSANVDRPYDFFDDYIDALASFELKDNVDLSFLDKEHGRAKLYVELKEKNIEKLTTDNIESSVLVVGLYSAPGNLIVRNLYDLYKEYTANEYKNATMIVMFAENTNNFNSCINNYGMCDKIGLTKDINTIYKTVNIEDNDLNLENFKSLFKP